MRFLTFAFNGEEQFGVMLDQSNSILNLSQYAQKLGNSSLPLSLLEAIQQGESFISWVEDILKEDQESLSSFYHSIEQVKILAPIPRPLKNIFCVGKNYKDHAIEMGSEADVPKDMIIFTKAPTTVTGHLSEIDLHSEVTSELDYEGELAAVIGKKGKNISEEEALDYVFGYTILNDVTARDLQEKHKQYFLGKSLDTSCPIGPWVVHHSEIMNPGQLGITTKVNGEIRQDSNTENFIFPLPEIISVLSKGRTLEPGDIIATGTPAGVGKGFKPPKFLKQGDKIDITVEGIGTLTNTVK